MCVCVCVQCARVCLFSPQHWCGSEGRGVTSSIPAFALQGREAGEITVFRRDFVVVIVG